jgi:hypothetical protein
MFNFNDTTQRVIIELDDIDLIQFSGIEIGLLNFDLAIIGGINDG